MTMLSEDNMRRFMFRTANETQRERFNSLVEEKNLSGLELMLILDTIGLHPDHRERMVIRNRVRAEFKIPDVL